MSVPSLAVWKFASCDGCQLTLLDCEDELLTLAGEVRIATFLEASSAFTGGPYDISLVEGSITTPADERRIREIREQSKILVTIGACATAGESRRCATCLTSTSTCRWSTRNPATSRRSRPRHRPLRMCASTTNCKGVRSTAASCWTHSQPSSSDANPGYRPRPCAPNASFVVSRVFWWPNPYRAWGPSPTPGAVRCARRVIAAAMDVSGRQPRRTPQHSSRCCAATG